MAVAAATWGVQVNPTGVAVVAPAAIVCVAPLLIAIAAAALVGVVIEQLSASDPPSEPGVTTFTVWLPVPPVSVGPAESEATGADATGAAGVTRLNDTAPGGRLLSVPVKSLQSVLVASRRPISPLASIA